MSLLPVGNPPAALVVDPRAALPSVVRPREVLIADVLTLAKPLHFGSKPDPVGNAINWLLDRAEAGVTKTRTEVERAYNRLRARRVLQPNLYAPIPANHPGRNRFAVIGDPGSGSADQYAVAEQLKKKNWWKPFASVMVLGDNVYEFGEMERFHPVIWKPYKDLFEKGIKFFPILGNHDVMMTRGEEQLNYWGAKRNYKLQLGDPGPDGTPQVELFAIDTTILLPKYAKVYPKPEDQAWAKAAGQRQLAWLDAELGKSKAKYKIVMGHYPLYSSGMHGKLAHATPALRAMVEPLLVKHGVDVYLAGHEHHYERSEPIHGVTHILSGGAGKTRRVFYNDGVDYPRAKAESEYHFMLFEITPEGLKYEAITSENETIDSGVITK